MTYVISEVLQFAKFTMRHISIIIFAELVPIKKSSRFCAANYEQAIILLGVSFERTRAFLKTILFFSSARSCLILTRTGANPKNAPGLRAPEFDRKIILVQFSKGDSFCRPFGSIIAILSHVVGVLLLQI